MGPLEKGGDGHSPLVPAEGLHLQGESPVVASRGQPGHESGPVHGAVKGQEVLIPRAVVIVEMESGEAGPSVRWATRTGTPEAAQPSRASTREAA